MFKLGEYDCYDDEIKSTFFGGHCQDCEGLLIPMVTHTAKPVPWYANTKSNSNTNANTNTKLISNTNANTKAKLISNTNTNTNANKNANINTNKKLQI